MALNELAIRVLFGDANPPSVYFVGLGLGRKELDVVGYERVKVRRRDWLATPGKASVLVRFGPFEEGALFDTTLLFAGDEMAAEMPIVGAPVRTVAGMGLEHHV
ncbi:MAG: hypothetical protein ACREJP_10260, partial [Candidatus Methylomirabilales bacterium]